MKALKILFFYLTVFMGTFFIFSAIGLLWCDSYSQIIRNPNWFMMYTIFLGWWIALMATHEVYEDLYEVL
jgi:hypothetical protein